MRVRKTQLSANECEAVVAKRVRKLWLKESGQKIGAGTPTTESGNQPFDIYAKLLSKLSP